ncbi:protein of unknown function [Candidatus Filomicrobium marinum]|uniref:Uncharacterized protein n=1 Tax=Candidatus Filomicrobium marinum TaxID=1608628 RepID=A0A0D6JJU0_9HYPH|nr:protein of unknown function [Candidatus Filomicrobium marinum]CPR21947.1 protein of unknown function [Candidatus Filomicrobium marinum]
MKCRIALRPSVGYRHTDISLQFVAEVLTFFQLALAQTRRLLPCGRGDALENEKTKRKISSL